MRMAGQNPTLAQSESMIAKADADGTGMLIFSDVVTIRCSNPNGYPRDILV
jgi:hypothetical protein